MRPSFVWVAIAVWLRMFLPAVINFIEQPHHAVVVGMVAPRTVASGVASVATTALLAIVCVIVVFWPPRDRRRAQFSTGLIVLAPLGLAVVQALAYDAFGPGELVTYGLCLLMMIAVWISAPTFGEVSVIGYLGGLSASASVALAFALPEHAAFVDTWGTPDSTKAIIGDYQIAGIFGHSNTLGMVCVMSVAVLLYGRGSLLRNALIACTTLALVLSASRTALIAFGVLAVYAIMAKVVRHDGRELGWLLLIPPVLVVAIPPPRE